MKTPVKHVMFIMTFTINVTKLSVAFRFIFFNNFDTITKPICSTDGTLINIINVMIKKYMSNYYISDSGFIIDLSSDITSFNENVIK